MASAQAKAHTIIIPTLNPGQQGHTLIELLGAQSVCSDRVIIIDSGSRDGSPDAFEDAGFQVHRITKAEFDHGGTRNLGIMLSGTAEIAVFITQDALPTGGETIASILAPFADASVGLVYGRQLPREQAGPIESHARCFNYPDAPASRDMQRAASLGIKAIFNSNSFAAYRIEALQQVGGFPSRIIMGEDQVAAARMLLAGWKVVYQASATVRHSHDYSVLEEFRRYFDIGVFHDNQRDLLAHFGRPESEGRRFIRSEIDYLLARAPGRVPEALLRNALKLAGYRLGQASQRLPAALKRRLAMNAGYFRSA